MLIDVWIEIGDIKVTLSHVIYVHRSKIKFLCFGELWPPTVAFLFFFITQIKAQPGGYWLSLVLSRNEQIALCSMRSNLQIAIEHTHSIHSYNTLGQHVFTRI